jgi:putative toxin-antitoxin system antitoxin component (TIGR02293 family)
MVTTLSSPSSAAAAGTRSQAFKSLLEIIVSGCHEHSKRSGRLTRVGSPDHVDWLTKSMPFPSATAYKILRCGVPSRSLSALGDYLGMGKGPLADVVGLSRATTSRMVTSGQPLPMHVAESVLRLVELQCLAEDTFDTSKAASAWLCRGHPMLDGDAPVDWAKSAYGSERVKEILTALKYGSVV